MKYQRVIQITKTDISITHCITNPILLKLVCPSKL